MKFSSIVVAALTIASAVACLPRPASAEIEGVWVSMTSPDWDWERPRPFAGRPDHYDYVVRQPRPGGQPVAAEYAWPVDLTWDGPRLKSERRPGSKVVTYNAQGRPTSIVWSGTFVDGPGKTPRVSTKTERADYAPDGTLRGFASSRSDGTRVPISAQSSTGADGTQTIVFQSRQPGPTGKVTVYRQTLIYRPDGRLDRERQELDGKLWIDGPVLTYNDHGDVASTDVPSADGKSHDATVYTYEYDDEGNWTRRSARRHVGLRHAPPDGGPWLVVERRFHYPQAGAAPVATGGVAGKYHGRVAMPDGRPFSDTEMQLLAGGTLRFTVHVHNYLEGGDNVITHTAGGTWTIAGVGGRSVKVVLAPDPGQPPVPPEESTEQFTESIDGRSLQPARAGQPTFIRDP
jgi:hypothetical protein